jgi:hypothetical protein
MQTRCACTEVTLGLKEATRSGEKGPGHVQRAINAMAASDTECANVNVALGYLPCLLDREEVSVALLPVGVVLQQFLPFPVLQ